MKFKKIISIFTLLVTFLFFIFSFGYVFADEGDSDVNLQDSLGSDDISNKTDLLDFGDDLINLGNDENIDNSTDLGNLDDLNLLENDDNQDDLGNLDNSENSDSGDNSENTKNSSTGENLDDIQTFSLEIPEIKIQFQRATYLLEKDDLEKTLYNCDNKESECKLNLNLTGSFVGYKMSKYICEVDYGFEIYKDKKCNPPQIIFPEGIHEIKIRIYEYDNEQNYREKIITIDNNRGQSGEDSGNSDENGQDNSELSGDSNNSTDDDNSSSGEIGENGDNSQSSDNEENSDNSENFEDGENSGSGEISSSQDNFGSGEIAFTGEIFEIPEVEIEVQTGLKLIDDVYHCNKNTKGCSVNLNLEKLFTGVYDKKNYACEWDFGSGTLSKTGDTEKCNPNAVYFGTGEFTIEAKIYQKNYKDNFKTGSLTFIYGTTSSGSQNSGNQYITTNLELPSIVYKFQSPSYILDKEAIKDEYTCDPKYEICKINLDLRDSFSGSKFTCEVDFGFETPESDKGCNPGTVELPVGENQIIFKIFEKSNPQNFVTKEIIIYNSGEYLATDSDGEYKIREIIIQTGAILSGDNIYVCDKEICKINLDFKNSKSETCLWDFGNADFKEKYTQTCNPGYVYYGIGEHRIKLEVYNQNSGNYDYYSILLKNNFVRENLPFQGKIVVQGKLSKNKILIDNKLTCINSEKCSVNFTAEFNKDISKKSLEFFWDFGNGESFSGQNPKSIEYLTGSYIVTLTIKDKYGESEEVLFFVEVYDKVVEIADFFNEDIVKYIRISKVMPNPNSGDEEYIIIQNIYFLPVNLKGLTIDDIVDGGSKAYTFKNDYYLLPFQSKKFFKSDLKLNLNNSSDEVNLLYNGEIIDNVAWEKSDKNVEINDEGIGIKNANIGKKIDKIEKNYKKEYQKQVIKEFTALVKDILGQGVSKIKIISYKTSKLKSGIKITGTTFPNAKITLKFIDNTFVVNSDNDGNYKILITSGLKEGKYKLFFTVESDGEIYDYESPRYVEITQKYLSGYYAYRAKKNKQKTASSSKISKPKNMKYEVKTLNNSSGNSDSSQNDQVYVFLTMFLTGGFGFFTFRRFS